MSAGIRHVIAKAVQTCIACPSQWNAWTTTGQYLYLRYRSGIGTVDAYDDPDPDTWTNAPDGSVARFGTPSLDGSITLEDFCAAAGLTLAPGATVDPDGPRVLRILGPVSAGTGPTDAQIRAYVDAHPQELATFLRREARRDPQWLRGFLASEERRAAQCTTADQSRPGHPQPPRKATAMAKVVRSRSSSLQIRSNPPYQGGMTVWALRDFVRTLDAEGVSDETRVTCDHSHDTRHLTGLWVQETSTEEQPEKSPPPALDHPQEPTP